MLVRILALSRYCSLFLNQVYSTYSWWALVTVLMVSLYCTLFLYQFVPCTCDECWLEFWLCLHIVLCFIQCVCVCKCINVYILCAGIVTSAVPHMLAWKTCRGEGGAEFVNKHANTQRINPFNIALHTSSGEFRLLGTMDYFLCSCTFSINGSSRSGLGHILQLSFLDYIYIYIVLSFSCWLSVYQVYGFLVYMLHSVVGGCQCSGETCYLPSFCIMLVVEIHCYCCLWVLSHILEHIQHIYSLIKYTLIFLLVFDLVSCMLNVHQKLKPPPHAHTRARAPTHTPTRVRMHTHTRARTPHATRHTHTQHTHTDTDTRLSIDQWSWDYEYLWKPCDQIWKFVELLWSKSVLFESRK
jgi:hypothetical protein